MAKKDIFSRYKTYEGERGSPEQWAGQARALIKFDGQNVLSLLNLDQIPTTIEELKKARRAVMLSAHPDKGGSTDLAARINSAYQAMEKLILLRKPKEIEAKPIGLVDPPRCTAFLPDSLEDASWIFEEKIDGERFVCYIGFDPYDSNQFANTILSRHKSALSGRYTDRSENAPHITGIAYPALKQTVLDGEIFHTSLAQTVSIMSSSALESAHKQRMLGPVDYITFDISFHKGRDVRGKPYQVRRKLLESVVLEMNNPRVKLVPQYHSGIEENFQRLTALGMEGLVGKHVNGRYGELWAKLKKVASVSCIISGYRPGKDGLEGKIGSLCLSVYKSGRLVEVGFAAGLTNKMIDDMTDNFDQYFGQVVDVFCMELTKNIRLRSPTFHRIRTDINPGECTMDKLTSDLLKTLKSRMKT